MPLESAMMILHVYVFTFILLSDTPAFYMHFLNGEGHSAVKETASLETPAIHAYNTCLSFWYSVPSKYSNLKVLVRNSTGLLRLIWSIEHEMPSTRLRNGTRWYTEAIEITEDPPFTVRLFLPLHLRYDITGLRTSATDICLHPNL